MVDHCDGAWQKSQRVEKAAPVHAADVVAVVLDHSRQEEERNQRKPSRGANDEEPSGTAEALHDRGRGIHEQVLTYGR